MVETFEDHPAPSLTVTKVIRSLYDMQKTAAKWDICDFNYGGVIKSPDVKT